MAWHHEDIKAALRKSVGTITALSEAWGYHRSAVSRTLREAAYSRPIEKKISQTLGVPLHELWPDRWSPEGEKLASPQTPADPSSTQTGAHRQIVKVA